MIGIVLAIAVVFAILFVVTRSVAYYRGELSVAGAETQEAEVGQPAAVGAAAGLVVLLLMALLYVGVTRWEWFGNPTPKAPPVAAPAKESAPPVVSTAAPTPSAAAGVPTPSPQK